MIEITEIIQYYKSHRNTNRN